ncbi:cytochrome c [uncultured Rhodoblastus sp.]|uniref:c-type cytochrome n=1 Tax=uncultured Rhodoblastus sp. TaxID=543037 RepID=UPI0025F9A9A2|nr:cytochrome c [uncultured Rhodoblastus sp.]
MKKLLYYLSTALLLAAAVGNANAQAVGDPKEGLGVAQKVCAECHATVAGQDRSPRAEAPTFVKLAATPGMTRTALLVALTTPHAGMPMFMLSAKQRDDIIAHILSLN